MTIDIKKNKSFCPYPFYHSYIGSRYERKLCCVSDDIEGYDKTSQEEFWNSDYMKEVRQKMILGEKIDVCGRCYDFEKLGLKSLRLGSGESAVNEHSFAKLMDGYDYETGEMKQGPSYFDHRTIHCNLQCVSCGPPYSSTHQILHEKMWGGKINFTIDEKFEDIYGQEIIDALESKRCESIYWAGGEPTMSKMHWNVVEKLRELSQNPDYAEYVENLRIHYNTNLTRLFWKGNHIPSLLEFYQPSIQASIDGTHETFEYCRDGGKWGSVSVNWDQYYEKLNKRKQFGIASVLSSPVLMDIDRWFEFFSKYDITIYNHKYACDISSYPHSVQAMLDVRLLPQHIFDRVVGHAIEKFEKCDMPGADVSISYLKSYITERQENKDFFDNESNLRIIKRNTMRRDQFLKTPRPFHELLNIIDKETYEWYSSIKHEY